MKSRKRLATAAALGAALLLTCWVLAAWTASRRAEALSRAMAEQLSVLLAQPVQFDGARLSLFPWPAECLDRVRIGPEQDPFARLEQACSNLSLPGLVIGKLALRSIELRGASLDLDARERSERASADSPAIGAQHTPAENSPLLLVTSVSIADGTVQRGPWRIEHVQADASLRIDGALVLRGSGELAGLGALRALDLTVRRWTSGRPEWSGSAELEQLNLAGVRTTLALDAALAGTITGRIEAAGAGTRLTRASLALAGAQVDWRQSPLQATGDLELRGDLPGRLVLNLDATRIEMAGQLAKPPAQPLQIALDCALDPDPQATSLPCGSGGKLELVSGPAQFHASIAREDGATPAAEADGVIDLAALRGWWLGEPPVESGEIRIRDARFDPQGAHVLAAELRNVTRTFPLPGRPDGRLPVVANGTVAVTGSRVTSSDLQLEALGQRIQLALSADLADQSGAIDFDAPALDLGVMSELAFAKKGVQGRIDASGSFSGSGLADLTGKARITASDGFVPGVLLPFPPELQPLRAGTPAGGERFRRITAAFSLEGGKARFQTLSLDHDMASFEFAGDIALADAELDLVGQILLSADLDASLGGPGRLQILPIEHIRGHWPSPDIEFDRKQMSEIFLGYAAYLKAREKERAQQSAPAR